MDYLDLTGILIGIQARSSSTRLPKKCFELIGPKRLLDHVIDNCTKAMTYSNRHTFRRNFTVDLALLIPENDPIKKGFFGRSKMVEGPLHDVLTRYVMAQKLYNADYVCRITGDCPLLPPYIISKHITLAAMCKYDYITNGGEDRLSLDGIDCEIISAKMLKWLDENATTEAEREHVTIKARLSPPPWAKRGFTAGFFDQSHIKLSVDTKEDLSAVRDEYERVEKKLKLAEKIYGRECIHRF